jgi:CheY-like chemotaxis protein
VFQRLHGLPQMAACRFIALSADAMPESIEASLAAGFDDYWTKPIQFDHFLAQIDQLIQQRAASWR